MISRSWRPHQESNLELALRRGPLYPFNYEDGRRDYTREAGEIQFRPLYIY